MNRFLQRLSSWGALAFLSFFLFASCKLTQPPKITATDIGKYGPGAQTIKGGNVTFTLSAAAKPESVRCYINRRFRALVRCAIRHQLRGDPFAIRTAPTLT